MVNAEQIQMIKFQKRNGMKNSELMKCFKLSYAELKDILEKE